MSNEFWSGYLTASLIALFSILIVGNIAHCKEDIRTIIVVEAAKQGLDPQVALSIATIESSLNPRAIGPVGEIGLFQVRPEFSSYSKSQLFDPRINAQEGIKLLLKYKKICPLQEGLTYIVCFNNGTRKPKYPFLHPYYKRFVKVYANL